MLNACTAEVPRDGQPDADGRIPLNITLGQPQTRIGEDADGNIVWKGGEIVNIEGVLYYNGTTNVSTTYKVVEEQDGTFSLQPERPENTIYWPGNGCSAELNIYYNQSGIIQTNQSQEKDYLASQTLYQQVKTSSPSFSVTMQPIRTKIVLNLKTDNGLTADLIKSVEIHTVDLNNSPLTITTYHLPTTSQGCAASYAAITYPNNHGHSLQTGHELVTVTLAGGDKYAYKLKKGIELAPGAVYTFDIALNIPTLVDPTQGNVVIKDSGTYLVTGTAEESFQIEFRNKTNPTIILQDAVLNCIDSPIAINESNVTLVLRGNNKLSTSEEGYSGIGLRDGSLTIKGDGSLTVEGKNAPGIGILEKNTSSIPIITINGGIIHAKGSGGSAAIGTHPESENFQINIYGGEVTAELTDNTPDAAAIGNGAGGQGGTIEMENCTINIIRKDGNTQPAFSANHISPTDLTDSNELNVNGVTLTIDGERISNGNES